MSMENNTQLPVEVVKEISEKAHELAMNNTDLGYLPSDRIIQSIENRVKILATAYATKLHQLQQENEDKDLFIEMLKIKHDKARTLLSNVYNDFIGAVEMSENKTDKPLFKKIKKFLHGE